MARPTSSVRLSDIAAQECFKTCEILKGAFEFESDFGSDLIGLRVPVGRRPALHDVRDEDVVADPADVPEQALQQAAGATDERSSLPILVGPGALPDEHHLGIRIAFARDRARPRLVESTAGAAANLGFPPKYGQHTREVLAETGLTAGAIASLYGDGIVA